MNLKTDLFETPLQQAEVDFENAGGETYICGNPPYLGSKYQNAEQKADVVTAFGKRTKQAKSLDYVCAWLVKAAEYATATPTVIAFVATNSICQGQSVPILWPVIFELGQSIVFAHTSFKWANLAANKAGVTVVIVGISSIPRTKRSLFSMGDDGSSSVVEASNINAYLVAAPNVNLVPASAPLTELSPMQFGNHFYYGAPLLFSALEGQRIKSAAPESAQFLRPVFGSSEVINGVARTCIWVADNAAKRAIAIPQLKTKIEATAAARRKATQDKSAQKLAETPWRFRDQTTARHHIIAIPSISSERRQYLPVGLLDSSAIVTHKCFAMYDAPLWNMAVFASRLHWVWIGTVCVRLEMRFSYSNTLGWNTFPVPKLTETNKADLTRAAERILLAREAHFPATIADLYDPDAMPENLKQAHDHNDELIERIYIGRRFKNDTERLEKLFDMYTKIVASQPAPSKAKKKPAGAAKA